MSEERETGLRHWLRIPAPDLRDWVTGIHGVAEAGRRLRGYVEPASLTAPLILNFGSPYRIALGHAPGDVDQWTSFAAGLFAGPVVMDSDGAPRCIQVDFTPLGARRFFRRPMNALANRLACISDLEDREILELAAGVAEAGSWDARLDLTESFVRARLTEPGPIDAEISWAYGRLRRARGDLRTGWLADQLGWSRAKLLRRFERECGLAPKAVARILRFNAALAMSKARKAAWADVAVACGYADQAHLTREFVEFAGSPPETWRRGA